MCGPDPGVDERAAAVERLLPERAPRRDRAAGEDVDQHVEPLALAADAREERRDVAFDEVVDTYGNAFAAGGRHQLGGLLNRFRAAGVVMVAGVRLGAAAAAGAVDDGAGFAEHACDAAAGAAGGAGDKRDVSVEWFHWKASLGSIVLS